MSIVINMKSIGFQNAVKAKVIAGMKISEAIAEVKAEWMIEAEVKAMDKAVKDGIFQELINDGIEKLAPADIVAKVKALHDKRLMSHKATKVWSSYPTYLIYKVASGWKKSAFKLCYATDDTIAQLKLDLA